MTTIIVGSRMGVWFGKQRQLVAANLSYMKLWRAQTTSWSAYNNMFGYSTQKVIFSRYQSPLNKFKLTFLMNQNSYLCNYSSWKIALFYRMHKKLWPPSFFLKYPCIRQQGTYLSLVTIEDIEILNCTVWPHSLYIR